MCVTQPWVVTVIQCDPQDMQELREIFLELPEEGAKWNAKRLVRNLQIV